MNIDENTAKKVQELQFLDQNLQGFIAQKQSIQLELNETDSALDEIKKADDSEIYKITGGIMIKANRRDSENGMFFPIISKYLHAPDFGYTIFIPGTDSRFFI